MANTNSDVLTIRPGFLEDDDDDTIQRERKAANRKGKKGPKVSHLLHAMA